MESSIEELYLEAEADFKNSAFTEAFLMIIQKQKITLQPL